MEDDFRELTDVLGAIDKGNAIEIPDYSVEPEVNMIRPEYGIPGKVFYSGALTALSVLGSNETLSHDELIKLARKLTHECKYNLNRLK